MAVIISQPSIKIGALLGGGIVFYIDTTGKHGLICATSDIPAGVGYATWGCTGTTISGTNTAIGTGQANTTLIVAGCATAGIAARLCNDLVLNNYSDWYLPSLNELDQMYKNLHLNSIGGFVAYAYWSSSEVSAADAWCQNFINGSQGNYYDKSSNYYVRAVRSF